MPRYWRILEVGIGGLFLFLGVFAAFFAPRPNPGMGAGLAGFGLLAILMFELRIWGHRRRIARVTARLDEVAARDLESPTKAHLRPADELVDLAGSFMGGYMAARSTRVCVTGKWRGREVEIGTNIVAGRDMDWTFSYLALRGQGVRAPMRIMTKGMYTSMARMMAPMKPVPTGDAAFDDKWVADGDEAELRAVLDPPMRAQLLQLQAQLSWLQGCSIAARSQGVLVRWPGELTTDGAAYLRDLLLTVHDRISAATRAA